MYVALAISILASIYIIYSLLKMRSRERAGILPTPKQDSPAQSEPKKVVNPEFQFDDPKPGETG